MKSCLTYFFMLLLPVSFLARAQGFEYDQQSSDESHYLEGGAGLGQQPFGQSFVPTMSFVGFIRIFVYSSGLGSGTFYINLRSNSIAGNTTIQSTTPVALTSGFSGPVDFYFSSPVSVNQNTTYFFQPVVQTGGGWGTLIAGYKYSGGTAFINGAPVPNSDLWFREGIVVPEPSSVLLVLLGGGVAAWRHRKKQRAG